MAQLSEMKERLRCAEETNGDDRRLGNLNTLNALQVRLEFWMSILKERDSRGPSSMELAVILDDLNVTALDELEQRACRRTGYERQDAKIS